MLSYYTFVLVLCWIAMGAMCVLVGRNDRIPRGNRRLLYITYVLVSLSALAEWCGVQLDGRDEMSSWMLRFAKCADYILTPAAGGALTMQMQLQNTWQKVLIGILTANTALQIISLPGEWMVVIDAGNHYYHGPLFPVYLGICFSIILIMIIQSIIYGKAFRKQNRFFLYTIMFLVVTAISIQELFFGFRTACLGMTFGAVLMFIHYTEFSQQTADEAMTEQRVRLMLSQINPHFLFNCLGSIEALCERDPKAAKLATRRFSKYLRGNMDSLSDEKLIPFEKELQHTKFYLELEEIRFGDALHVEYDIRAHDFFLPPLTLEPIVENAVRHGIRMKTDGRGSITISSEEYDDSYILRVRDDGVGFDPEAVSEDEPHIGIKNVRERLQRVCGGTLTIRSAIGEGAVAVICIPKEKGQS